MHIAMIGQKGLPARGGGIETHVEALSRRMAFFGHTVTVYSRRWYTNAEDQTRENLSVKHLSSIRTKHLDTVSHCLLATLHAVKSGADIFHYHGVGPSLFAWIPRLISPGASVVCTFHCIDRQHEKWGWFAKLWLFLGEWTACTFAHETITVSPSLTRYARERFGVNARYIPNGVEASVLKPRMKPETILAVSRLIPHKGIHHLVTAFRAVPKNIRGNVTLTIVGDGHYTDAYVETLKTAAGNDCVIFTGALPRAEIMERAGVALAFVHPSKSEGMPIAVLEAMSLGLPVLLSDIPEHRDLGVSPEYFFPPDNADALRDRLITLLKQSEASLRSEGEKNRAIVAKQFQWDDVAKKTADAYREVTTTKQRFHFFRQNQHPLRQYR